MLRTVFKNPGRIVRGRSEIQCRALSHAYNVNTNLSDVSGSTGIRLMEKTIGEQLRETATKHPDILALVSHHQGRRLTYAQFDHEVNEVAKSLLALNLPPGANKIGVYAPNCEEWVLLQFATARIGYVLVNINPSYQVNDLRYVLQKVEINTLVMPRFLKSSNYINIVKGVVGPELTAAHQDPLCLKLPDLPDLKQVVLLEDHTIAAGASPEQYGHHTLGSYDEDCAANNMLSWNKFYSRHHIATNGAGAGAGALNERFHRTAAGVQLHDPVNIQFTSGTTGLPKGAVLSHFNILNNGYLTGSVLDYTYNPSAGSDHYKPPEKVLIQVPLYHCFGTVMGNLACIAHGATMVYPNGYFDASKSLAVIEQERITSLYGVPTMFLEVLNQQLKQKRDVGSLRTGIMAGAICPKVLMERCTNELGLVDLTICYGMTELAPVTHQTSPHDSFIKKTTTVGTLLPHTSSKIVDDEGRVVPRGELGEILTKGYGVMLGYYNEAEATRAVIDSDGYMKTGDLGRIDDDGYFYIEGRKKDIIIRGGENISPKEIEDYLLTHPAVDDVQVINVKDEKMGDEICAWIKLKDGQKDKGVVNRATIIAYCKNQIAHYKIPRYVRFVDSFPLTVTGKQQKYVMREITNQIIADKSEEL